MTACKWVIHFVLNSGSVSDSTWFTSTNQINVFDLRSGIWKPETIFPYAAFLFHILNLNSSLQTPWPEWEWNIGASQGAVVHNALQCYRKCGLCGSKHPTQEDSKSLTMQSVGTDFNARLPFPLQVHVTAMSGILKGTFEEADSASLCSSVQESDDDIFSCDCAESLDSVSLSTPDHLPVSISSYISLVFLCIIFGWLVLEGFSSRHCLVSASEFCITQMYHFDSIISFN